MSLASPGLASRFFTTVPPGKPWDETRIITKSQTCKHVVRVFQVEVTARTKVLRKNLVGPAEEYEGQYTWSRSVTGQCQEGRLEIDHIGHYIT